MTLPVNLPKALKGYGDLWRHAAYHTHSASPLFCLMTTSPGPLRTLCALLCSPWAALTCLSFPPDLEPAPPEPQVRTGHLWKSGGSHFWSPACYFPVLSQPKTTFSVGQHSLSRPLFTKCWVEGHTDMASPHTGLCRTASSSVCPHVIQLL